MEEARKQLYKDEADNLAPLDPLEYHYLASHRQGTTQAQPLKSGSPSAASKPNVVQKRDLRVLMSLRHKASQLSKGTVHTDPVQEAIRNRSARALGAEAKMGAQQGDIGVAELKQTVEVHAEIELRRRATRLGVVHLAGTSSSAPMGVTGFLNTLGLVGGSKEEMEQKAKTVFEAMDKDKSGALDREEIAEGLEGLGVMLEGQQLEDLLYSAGISEETGKTTMGISEFVQLVLLANHEGQLFGEKGGAHGSRGAGRTVQGRKGSIEGGIVEEGNEDLEGEEQAMKRYRGSDEHSGGSGTPQGSGREAGSAMSGSFRSSRSGGSRPGSRGSGSTSRSSNASGSSKSYQSSGLGPGNLYGSRPYPPPQPPPRERLLSAQGTNVYADDLLQSRLKTLESALKAVIATQGRERDMVFSTAIRRGRLSMVTTEYRFQQAKALWTGPVQPTLAQLPEGIGIFDYHAYSERMGSMSGERRMYYAGSVVAGQRQGPGVLRWIDETEYAGMWMGGRPMGSGVVTYTDGSWYAGGFKDDKRHGMGGLWFVDGTVFIGQWQLGLQHGVGVMGHVSSVLVDRWGRGREEMPVDVDVMTGQLAKVYRETHERAEEMKEDFVRSIYSKRFDQEACSNIKIMYIAEYNLGERVGSVHYSQQNDEHKKLAVDCLYSVRAGQRMGQEAAEYAREAWAKRRAAMTVFRIRERGNEERRKMGIGGQTAGAAQVIEEEEETENFWQEGIEDAELIAENKMTGEKGLDGLVVEIVAGRMLDGLGEDVAAGIRVEVSVDDDPQPLTTAVCWGTKSPVWAGESVYVPVRTDYTVLRCVVLKVEKDEENDENDELKETYLGEVHLNACDMDHAAVLDKWFDLEFADQGQERVERALYVVKTTLWRWFWIIIGDSTMDLMGLYLRQWNWVSRRHKATRTRGLSYCLNINPLPVEHRLSRDAGVVYHRSIPPKRHNSHHLAIPVFGALHLRIGCVVHPLCMQATGKHGSNSGSSDCNTPAVSDPKGSWDANSPASGISPTSSLAVGESDGQKGVAAAAEDAYDAEISRAREEGMGMIRVEFESTHRVSQLLGNANKIWAEASIADCKATTASVGVQDFDTQACEPRKLNGQEAHRRGVDLNQHCHVPATLGHNYITVKLKVGGGGRGESFQRLESASSVARSAPGSAVNISHESEGDLGKIMHPVPELAEASTGFLETKEASSFHESHASKADIFDESNPSSRPDTQGMEEGSRPDSTDASVTSSKPPTRGAGVGFDVTPDAVPFPRPPSSGGSQSGGRNHGRAKQSPGTSEIEIERAASAESGVSGMRRSSIGHSRRGSGSSVASHDDGLGMVGRIETEWEKVIGEAQILFGHLQEGDGQEMWVQLEDASEVSGELVVDLLEARDLASNGRNSRPIGRVLLEWLEEDSAVPNSAFSRLGTADTKQQRARERTQRLATMDKRDLAHAIDAVDNPTLLQKLTPRLRSSRGRSPRAGSRGSPLAGARGRGSPIASSRGRGSPRAGSRERGSPRAGSRERVNKDGGYSPLSTPKVGPMEKQLFDHSSILKKTHSSDVPKAVERMKSVTLMPPSRESEHRSGSREKSRRNLEADSSLLDTSDVSKAPSVEFEAELGGSSSILKEDRPVPRKSPGESFQRVIGGAVASWGDTVDGISALFGQTTVDATEAQRRLSQLGLVSLPGGWCRDQWVSDGALDFTGSFAPRWDSQRGVFQIRTGLAVITIELSAQGRDATQVKGGQADGFLGSVCLTLQSILPKLRPGAQFQAWFPLQQRACGGSSGADVVSGDVLLGFHVRPRPMNQRGSLKLKLLCEAMQPKPSLAIDKEKRLAKALDSAKSIGLVEVTVFRARGLAPYHLRSPVLLLSLGGNNAKAAAKNNVVDPPWDEIFSLDVPLSDQKLHIRLFDALPPPPSPDHSADNSPAGSPTGALGSRKKRSLSPVARSTNRSPLARSPLARGKRERSSPPRRSPKSRPLHARSGASPKGRKESSSPLRRATALGFLRGGRPYSPLEGAGNGQDQIGAWKGGKFYRGEEATRIQLSQTTTEDVLEAGLAQSEEPVVDKKRRKRKKRTPEEEEIEELLLNGKEVGEVSMEIGRMAEGESTRGWFPIQSREDHFIVTAQVFEASGLTPVDLVSSDPYVMVTCADSACQTPVVLQNCDPVWDNQVFRFKAMSSDTDIYFDVFDYNRFESHVFLGRAVLKVADLPKVADKSTWYALGPRRGAFGDKVSRRYRSGEPIGSLKLEVSAVAGRTSYGELELAIHYLKEPPVHRAIIDHRIIEERSATGIGSIEVAAVAAALKSRGPGKEIPSPSCQIVVAESVSITNALESTLTPSWDQPFFLPVAPGTQHCIARVLNRGKYSKNDFWGETVVFLNELPYEDTDKWYRMDGKAPLGHVTVGVLSGANLVAADSNGLSDPFVEIRIGKQMLKSTAQKRTLDPIWDEDYTFEVWSVLDVIHVTVMDWDALGSNDFLGVFSIPIKELFKRAKVPTTTEKKSVASPIGSPISPSRAPGAKQAKHQESSNEYELGELDCGLKGTFKLKGLNGSGFVDARKTIPVTGTLDLDIRYVADPDLRARSSRVRLLFDYKERALGIEDAAEKEARSIEGTGGTDDALGDQRVFDEMEGSIKNAIYGEPVISRNTLRNTGILNSRSVVSQLELWRKHGGKTTARRRKSDAGLADTKRAGDTLKPSMSQSTGKPFGET